MGTPAKRRATVSSKMQVRPRRVQARSWANAGNGREDRIVKQWSDTEPRAIGKSHGSVQKGDTPKSGLVMWLGNINDEYYHFGI